MCFLTTTIISSASIELLKSFEAYRANPYIASTWETNYTIGYGHVIQDGGTSVVLNGKAYSSLTEEQVTELLIQDINNTLIFILIVITLQLLELIQVDMY